MTDYTTATGGEGAFYYAQGKKQPLVAVPNLFSLKLSASRAALSDDAEALLRTRAEPVAFIAHYGIKVYRSEVRDRTIDVLNREPAVEFATPVYRLTPNSPDVMYVTRRFLVQFKPEVTRAQIDRLNAQHGVQIAGALDYAENGYALLAPEASGPRGAVTLANTYFETGLVIFSHPDLIKGRAIKAMPAVSAAAAVVEPGTVAARDAEDADGTYLEQQWHLTTARVRDAWATTTGSPSITICILDDGCDTQHPEFDGKISAQFDFARQVADVTPQGADDNHGTACAGVAAAAGARTFGAAPRCALMVGRTPRYLGVDDEARMFTWAADNGADVISCSWGPADGTGEEDPQPDNVSAAIHQVVKPDGRGRGGKGIAICWAAGNGNESVSLDGYAANPDVMAIAASTSSEGIAWYSDHGKEIGVCAPSSGNRSMGEKAIFTVDRRGADGYNQGAAADGDAAGDYTNSFGGTSSATPLVAGIIGLMLSVNADLTAAQIREILKQTADKIGSGYDAGGHSDAFGYGRVNALRAVQMAQQPPAVTNGPDVPPSIAGPESIDRSDDAPTFQITCPPGAYYAVEVAREPALLAAQQSAEGFFATWESSSLLSDPAYTLDAAAWERLKQGTDRLYYRLWTSTSQSEWENQAAYPPDDQIDTAPSMRITGDGADVSDRTDRSVASRDEPGAPTIEGPDAVDPRGDAPTFRIVPGGNPYFAVELATEPRSFFGDTRGQLPVTKFYGSWQDGLQAAAGPTTYTVPARVWRQLGAAPRLYYRVVTSASGSSWANSASSLDAAHVDQAPSISMNRPVVVPHGLADDLFHQNAWLR